MLETASENVYQSALKRIEKTEMAWGKSHIKLVSDLRNLAELFFVFGDFEKAKPLYWRILDIQQNAKTGLLNPEIADTLLSLGEIYEAGKDLARAEQLFQAALGILAKNDITGSEMEIRILLKLYAIIKMTNQDEKTLEIENKLYIFLQQYSAKTEAARMNTAVTQNNPTQTSALPGEHDKPRLMAVYSAA